MWYCHVEWNCEIHGMLRRREMIGTVDQITEMKNEFHLNDMTGPRYAEDPIEGEDDHYNTTRFFSTTQQK
jgi:hypothetical protein